jgi:hypothetical protein
MTKLQLHVACGILVLALASACLAQDGSLPNRPDGSWVKAENGLLINYERKVSAAKGSIRIYDSVGQPMVRLNVLPLVSGAKSAFIYDVSAVKGQMIAVSATYVKGQYEELASMLLIFDFNGRLESATAVDPARLLICLEIDGNSHIWGLSSGAGRSDPADAPVAIEFDRRGSVLHKVLTWDKFPSHADGIRQGPDLGAAVAGVAAGDFWFWLPGSTDLVVIRTKDGVISEQGQTGVPRIKDHVIRPLAFARLQSGELIGEFSSTDTATNVQEELTNSMWSPSAKTWTALDAGSCPDSRLVGTDKDALVYFRFDNSNAICTYRRK